MKFCHHKLANGLEIIGEYRDTAVNTALGFFVKTGARDETPQLAGVSHFLEHMLFKGTEKRSALDITFEMGTIGAQANAFTSEENTVYYMAVLPEYFNQALDILCDMMRPALDPKEFDTEKKVILEEIALYQDRPTHVLFESALKTHFGAHPAGNSVLGSHDSVSALSREQMKNYFDNRYSPSNIVFVVTGNFNWDKVIAGVESYCGDWKQEQVGREKPQFIASVTEQKLQKEQLQSAHVCLTTEGISADSSSRQALQALCTILGDHSGSRTYWQLVDKGIAESASIDSDEMDGVGLVYAYASSDPKNIPKVIDTLTEIMSSPKDFKEDDLERAKTKLATRLVLQGESTLRRLTAIGLDWQYRGKYTTLEEDVDRYRKLTREDLESVLEQVSLNPQCKILMLPA